MNIIDLRREINIIDENIVKLFNKRMELAAEIAEFKIRNDLAVYVPAREQEILKRLSEQCAPELAEYIQALYLRIFELSRDYQNKYISETSSNIEVI